MMLVKSTDCSKLIGLRGFGALSPDAARQSFGGKEIKMTTIIDGKAFAAKVRGQVADEVSKLKEEHGITPGLAVVLVGEDPASQVYVKNKHASTIEVGMNSFEHRLPAETSEADLLALIEELNGDESVHGILCQLPLPEHLNEDLVINSISPEKDVDGFHISNVGLLGTGQKSMVPCTPLGCLMMLRDHHGSLSGMNAVVVGRSNIVGKPMANLLLGDSCTVTIAHSAAATFTMDRITWLRMSASFVLILRLIESRAS